MRGLSVVAAVVLVVLVMHPGGGSVMATSASGYCKPNCTGMANGVKVPDPKNCTNYYLCMSGSPSDKPVPCDPGEVFDPAASSCVAGTSCEPACLPGGSACQLTCKAAGDIIADATDCSVYHFCGEDGPLGPFNCPCDRPYFDGVDCVNDASVCCSGYCDPYCDGSGESSFIPDPKDCYRYYFCDVDTPEGPPGEIFHFTCPANEYFSVQSGVCVAGNPEPCVTLCDAAEVQTTTAKETDTDTTTTTTTTVTGTPTTTTTTTGTGTTTTTTTTTGTPTTTTTTTTKSGCKESLTCPDKGHYASCDTCVPQYFDCAAAGDAGVLKTCSGNTVFNPNPDSPLCLVESNCPYYP